MGSLEKSRCSLGLFNLGSVCVFVGVKFLERVLERSWMAWSCGGKRFWNIGW